MMICGFTGLLEYLEKRWGTIAICARKVNQDSLESLFGHLRFLCGGGSDPSIFKAVHALPLVESQRDIKRTTARWRSMNSHRRDEGAGARGGDDSSGHLWQSLDAMSGGLVRSRR